MGGAIKAYWLLQQSKASGTCSSGEPRCALENKSSSASSDEESPREIEERTQKDSSSKAGSAPIVLKHEAQGSKHAKKVVEEMDDKYHEALVKSIGCSLLKTSDERYECYDQTNKEFDRIIDQFYWMREAPSR